MTNPYDRPSDPAKRHSAALTDGPDRAPARAMLKGIGFDDEALREAAGGRREHVDRDDAVQLEPPAAGRERQGRHSRGRWHADGVQHDLGLRRRLDGHRRDARVAHLARGDRRLDRARHAWASVRRAGRASSAATRRSRPPRWRSRGSTSRASSSTAARSRPGGSAAATSRSRTSSKASARTPPGRWIAAELHELESVACPGAGACGGQFTANTMAIALDFLGLSPPVQSGIPATAPGKAQAAKDAGALVMELVRENRLPSQILTHTAFRNAIAAVAATGGSTNAVLHLVAIADELGLELPLEEFDSISEATPVIADLKPGGRFVATDLYAAGGMPLLARELVSRKLVDGGAWSVAGSTLAELGAGSCRGARPGSDPQRQAAEGAGRPRDHARQPRARRLGDQARRARASPRQRACARLRLRGGLLRGRQGARDQVGRRGRHPLRGPARRPRHARDARTSPRRSSARASATRSRSSPTGASRARRTA